MPTVNPRINVTLPPSLDLLVVRLAAMQKTSKSQVLRELLEAAEPALQRAVMLMEAASTATADVRTRLGKSLLDAQERAEASLADELRDMDRMGSDLVDQAQAIRKRGGTSGKRSAPSLPSGGRPAKGAKGGSTPVPVTRGSGSSTLVQKRVKRGFV